MKIILTMIGDADTDGTVATNIQWVQGVKNGEAASEAMAEALRQVANEEDLSVKSILLDE